MNQEKQKRGYEDKDAVNKEKERHCEWERCRNKDTEIKERKKEQRKEGEKNQ